MSWSQLRNIQKIMKLDTDRGIMGMGIVSPLAEENLRVARFPSL
jgi:hypothetical protein